MKKLSKAILIGLAVLVALGVALAVFVNLYIQSPGSQARIQEELSKALRLPFKLTNVSVSPFGSLRITGITIPNGGANFLEAASFNAHYRWLPLLQGKLVITEMNVQSPKVVWAQTADGKWKLPEPEQAAKVATEETNATPAVPKPPETDQSKGESETTAGKKKSNFTLVIERFDVKGGTVELFDKENNHLAIFNDVNMTYTTLTPERVEGVATIGKLSWADTFTFENVSTPFKYADGDLDLPEITAAFAGGKLQAKYHTHEEKEHAPYKAAVTFTNIDLEKLGVPGTNSPAGTVPQAQASGVLTGQLEVHGDGKISDRLNGEAHIDLRNAQFHQLDFFQSMGQLLGLRELADLRVRDGHADLRLADSKVLVEKLILNTSDLQISANGTARLDKKLKLSAQLSAEDAVVEHLPPIIRDGFGPSDGGRRAVAFNITGDIEKPKTDLLDKFIKRKVDSQYTDVLSSIFNLMKKPDEVKKDDKKTEKERRKKDKATEKNAVPPSAAATPAPSAPPANPSPAATPAPPPPEPAAPKQ